MAVWQVAILVISGVIGGVLSRAYGDRLWKAFDSLWIKLGLPKSWIER